MRNLAELLHATANRSPEKIALTFQNNHISWQQLHALASLVAGQLKISGITRGQVVAIYAEHSPAQVVSIFAAAMVDAAFTIISTTLKENQISHQISDSDAKYLIGTLPQLNAVRSLCESRGIPALTIKQTGELAEASAIMPVPFPEKCQARNIPADVGCIIYTSGSTGRAKGVVLPIRTLLDGARIVSGYLKITSDDITLSLLPLNFDYGLNQILTTVYTGAHAVMHSFSFPQDLVQILIKENITGMAGVPSLWPHLFNPKLFSGANKPSFPHLRYITTAGGQHPEGLLRQLVDFFPSTEIIIMYGLTESFRSSYLPFSELFKRIGSIGKAVPEVELLVVNSSGELCKPGEKGELLHRGAFVSYGYLNNGDLNDSKFVRIPTGGNGCISEIAVRSGDVVSLDEDGFIYFHGRADMQIKSNGFRVSPGEVEEVALKIEGVSHAAAFGYPDPKLGEVVYLAYATYSGHEIDRDILRRHFTKALPSYAAPRAVKHYSTLPLTSSGKISYPTLKSDACDWESSGED
jgi:acyl-CoA synthetase (AMP-forming)/AMP-acid ligase II